MTTRLKRGLTTIGVIGTSSATVAAGVVFVLSLLNPQLEKLADNQSKDHDKLIGQEASVDKIPAIEESTQTTLRLIRYGIYPRLQLDEQETLKKAQEAEASQELDSLATSTKQ